MGEYGPFGENQQPGSEVAQELVALIEAGTLDEEQPMSDPAKPTPSYLTADGQVISAHPTRLATSRLPRRRAYGVCG